MTWEEFEKAMQEIKDQLLVNAQLVERYERRSIERMERMEDSHSHLKGQQQLLEDATRLQQDALTLHQAVLGRHEDRVYDLEQRQRQDEESRRLLEAAMRSLIEAMDRFLRGQQGNGQKGQQ